MARWGDVSVPAAVVASVLLTAPAAMAQDAPGAVALECAVQADGRFGACTVLSKSVGGGYADVALARAREGHIAVPPEGIEAGTTIQFELWVEAPLPKSLWSRDDDPRPGMIAAPEWVQAPAVTFPERAAGRGIETGRARARCVAAADGALTDCVVLSQEPPGADFGAALLAAAAQARLAPASVEASRPGAMVEISVNFVAAE